MSDQLTAQLQKMERQYDDLKKFFASDGQVTPDEQQTLKDVQSKIDALRQKVQARSSSNSNGAPAAPKPSPGGYLTESGWKSVLQTHAGKVRDNGLQRALAAYEKLKEDKYDERLKALQLVFQLALDLANKSASIPDVHEYLSKVSEFAVKKGELVEKAKKAGGFSETDKTMLRNMVIQAAQNVSVNGKANTALFGRQVTKACVAFQKHASGKLSDLANKTSAEELVLSLVSAAIPGIGKVLVNAVTTGIGKTIAGKMKDIVSNKLTTAAKSAGKESSKKDLEKAVEGLITAAEGTESAVLGVVTGTLMRMCDAVITGVNSGKELNPKLTAFIEPFINVQGAQLDAMLEAQFGVPSPAKAKQTQISMFQDMVRAFEEKLIIAETPSGVKMGWNGVPPHVRQNAQAKAQQAAKQHEREMEDVATARR